MLCHALDAVGLTGYRVGLGDASLYPRLMAACDVPEDARERLLHELATKDLVGLEHEVEALGLPGHAAELLVRVPQLRGGAGVLGAEAGPVADALSGLRAVLDHLDPGVAERVIFDLGRARGRRADAGPGVAGADPPRRPPRGGGGRYDDLLGRFGRSLPAVGFALGVDRLHAALSGAEHAGL